MHLLPLRVAVVLSLASFFSVACNRGDPKSCAYWVVKLENPSKEKESIDKLGELKCEEQIDVLAKQFEKSIFRLEIVKVLQGFGKNEKSIPVIRRALRDREASSTAARLVSEWQIKEAVPDIETIIKSPQNPGGRGSMLETLLGFVKPQDIVKTLIFLVGEDPTTQGANVNQDAAKRLQDIDWTKVDAETRKEAVDRLVTALFMKDAGGVSSYQAARAALGAIGPEAGPALVQAVRGKHAQLNQVGETYGLPQWELRDGPELIEVLWDVGDKEAALAIMESVARTGSQLPPELEAAPADRKEKWGEVNQNRMVVAAFSLAYLRNPAILPKAKETLLRPKPWVHQFMQTGNALGLMGMKEATEALFDVFGKLGERKDEGNQGNLVMAMAIGLLPDFLARYESEVVNHKPPPVKDEKGNEKPAPEDDSIRESARQPLALAYYKTVKQCGKDVGCYTKFLEAKKGKLNDIKKSLGDAVMKLNKKQEALTEKKKPVNEKIRALKKDRAASVEKALAMKKKSDETKKPLSKEEIDEFNKLVEDAEAKEKEMNPLFDELKKFDEEAKPEEKAVEDEQVNYYGLEKTVLTLAALDGVDHDAVFPIVLDIFHEADPAQFQQFRQWAFVYIERFATPARRALLEKLLESEKQIKNPAVSYFVFRLQYLLNRLKRQAATGK